MAYFMRTMMSKVHLAIVPTERGASMVDQGWAEIDAEIYMALVKLNGICTILDLRKAI
jgi:hypothetical protein